MTYITKPKIRNIIRPISYQGQQFFLVRDNLGLAKITEFPQVLVPLAIFCDGQRTVPEIEDAFKIHYGVRVPQPLIEDWLRQLDEVFLLESENFSQVKQQVLKKYREAPYRAPALAGASYPADPQALRRLLQGYLDKIEPLPPASADSRALICPHIDYQRGGGVYARLWASAAEAARQAELVIIIGTDHHSAYGTLTLTPQNYASPLGMMPTDKELVERLARVLSPELAFAEELHHIGEWSIELDLVWLQYMRGGEPCPILPILSGTFRPFMLDEADIKEETRFNDFVALLQEEMSKRRTLIVASGDLAHLGPEFDGPPLDVARYEQMKTDDDVLLNILSQGRAEQFFDFMKAGQFERNVCGLSPFYFTLKLLAETRGQLTSYDRCPADRQNTSFVSVCGMIFT